MLSTVSWFLTLAAPFTSSNLVGATVPIPTLLFTVSWNNKLVHVGALVVPTPINVYPKVPPALGAYIVVELVYACELFIVGNP